MLSTTTPGPPPDAPSALDDPGLSVSSTELLEPPPGGGRYARAPGRRREAHGHEQVECHVALGTRRLLRFPEPVTGLQGKFSLEYCIAAALSGDLWIDDFTDEAVGRPGIRAVRDLVRVVEGPPEPRPGVDTSATIRLRMSNGDAWEEAVTFPLGSPANPVGRDDVSRKFLRCSSGV